MTQPHEGTLSYPTIPEDNTEDPGNTEISATAMPRSPTTPETVEKATDTSKEQQATSQPQKWTMNGFPRQSSTAWHTTSLVHSGPVTSPPLLTHHPCQPRETTSLSTPPLNSSWRNVQHSARPCRSTGHCQTRRDSISRRALSAASASRGHGRGSGSPMSSGLDSSNRPATATARRTDADVSAAVDK